MHRAPQGVHDFLRAYYHHKSADWKDNKPYPLQSWSAGELAKLPTYYVMDLAKNMAETVAEEMPSAAAIAANQWLPDRELAFYSAEYERTGFQGGLQWYRCGTSGAFIAELADLVWPHASTCPPASSRANRTGAPISAPASMRRCSKALAPTCSAAIWSTAPAIGCSRSSPSEVSSPAAAVPEAGHRARAINPSSSQYRLQSAGATTMREPSRVGARCGYGQCALEENLWKRRSLDFWER